MRRNFPKDNQPSALTVIDDLDKSLNVTAEKFAKFAKTTNDRLKGIAMQMEKNNIFW